MIFWPGAEPDLSRVGPAALATMQHELQHVLDYRTGRLTAARYLLDSREWTYDVRDVGPNFNRLGAEQRATLVEHLWLAENGYRPTTEVADLRAIIPWAAQADGSLTVGSHAAA